MKKVLFKVLLSLAVLASATSCDKTKEGEIVPVEAGEYKFIRILVNDEITRQISLVDPVRLSAETFEARYPKSALYGTQSGRFGALVNSANNDVQLFDTGFEGHGDHVDIKGTPKFGALQGTGNKPTHFKSKGDEIITFNDGDGTLSTAKEAEFHTVGARMKTISAGNKAHHGAMTRFDNGTYAITEKDESVAGVLPERVKIIDASGKTLFVSTIQTKGIHGNASNGKISLFGSSSGILVVEPTGTQRLIPHPATFGTAWFGSILEATGATKFVGFTAAVGAYTIDPVTNQVLPVMESTDLIQVKVDYAGNFLIALLHSGEVRIYDLKMNKLVKSGLVIPSVAKDETQKPQIEATSKYLYITEPKAGGLLQIDRSDFTRTQRIKVSPTPYRLSIVGMESSQSH